MNIKSHFKSYRPYHRITLILQAVCLVFLCICAIPWRENIFYNGISFSATQTVMVIFLWLTCLGFLVLRLIFDGELRQSRGLAVFFLLVSPLYLFYTIETVTAYRLPGQTRLQNILGVPATNLKLTMVNVLLIACLVLALVLLLCSIRYGALLAAVVLILYSIVNLYVDEFRGTAITAADVMTVGTAADVAGQYDIIIKYRVYLGFLFLLLFWILSGAVRERLVKFRSGHVLLSVCCGVAVCFFAGRALIFSGWLNSQGISVSYFNTIHSYRRYGVAAVFARSLPDAFPRAPEGYSPEAAAEIAERYASPADEMEVLESESAVLPDERHPNIIVVIDESFTDLSLLGPLDTNEDPMPFFHSLEKDCIHGITYASVRGGMTANTEFEFLTGFSMYHLAPGTVPFQIYIKHELPSMASLMKERGWCGLQGFHPYTAGNYNRSNVYPLLGFSEFIHRENVPLEMDVCRKYPSDEADFRNVIRLYEETREESDRPFFLYNMTVQNHSPYDVDYDNFTPEIFPEGLKKDYKDVNAYLTLIRRSDDALKMLIGYFSEVEEPTVILFMGDHQPKLSDGFNAEVIGKKRLTLSLEETMQLYQVPYVIWANYELPETDLSGMEKTSMNYMQLNLLRAIGADLTAYQRFLQDLQQKIPMINAFGYMDSKGRFYEKDAPDSPYHELLNEYAILQYKILFDDKGA